MQNVSYYNTLRFGVATSLVTYLFYRET